MLQPRLTCSPRLRAAPSFKPHQRGSGCCSEHEAIVAWAERFRFQTPSAGRWVLQLAYGNFRNANHGDRFKPHQRGGGCCSLPSRSREGQGRRVSNPISGEVGAAAFGIWNMRSGSRPSFKPHQRGSGCCSAEKTSFLANRLCSFQTPSAGRWVLQPGFPSPSTVCGLFQTPSAGRWVLQHGVLRRRARPRDLVSNPISGEVGAAASVAGRPDQGHVHSRARFQTPSAGRWVLQRQTPSVSR